MASGHASRVDRPNTWLSAGVWNRANALFRRISIKHGNALSGVVAHSRAPYCSVLGYAILLRTLGSRFWIFCERLRVGSASASEQDVD